MHGFKGDVAKKPHDLDSHTTDQLQSHRICQTPAYDSGLLQRYVARAQRKHLPPSGAAFGPLALMTTIEVHPVSVSSSGLGKMEDRKRPAAYDNEEAAPPNKRQVTSSVNGGPRSHQDADVPGRDELEVCRTSFSMSSYLFTEAALYLL